MVIRRIREHAATHNWFTVAIDLAIVIAGVFLGMQVNNWNENRIERRTAENYRSRLVVELRSNEAQIQQKIAYYESVRRHGIRFLESLREPRSALGAQFLVDAYQLTQVASAPGKRFIFDEMVNAGFVRMLGSEDEQRLAADFYQQLEIYNAQLAESPPYRDTIRQEMPYEVQAYIRSNCGDQNVVVGGKLVGTALPESCSLTLPPATIAAAASKVRSIPNLEPFATRYIASIDQKLNTFRITLRQASELRRTLSTSD